MTGFVVQFPELWLADDPWYDGKDFQKLEIAYYTALNEIRENKV